MLFLESRKCAASTTFKDTCPPAQYLERYIRSKIYAVQQSTPRSLSVEGVASQRLSICFIGKHAIEDETRDRHTVGGMDIGVPSSREVDTSSASRVAVVGTRTSGLDGTLRLDPQLE